MRSEACSEVMRLVTVPPSFLRSSSCFAVGGAVLLNLSIMSDAFSLVSPFGGEPPKARMYASCFSVAASGSASVSGCGGEAGGRGEGGTSGSGS